MDPQMKKIISWGRYLYWANLSKDQFDGLLASSSSPEGIPTGTYFAYSSQWFAALHVVVEGWAELQLTDPIIERLLSEFEELRSLLKRYRNGVYHFQPDLLDNRFIGFVKSDDNWASWVRVLHDEFVRYFSDYLAALSSDPQKRAEIKTSINAIIGWTPHETFSDRIRELQTMVNESEARLAASNMDNTAARELREATDKLKRQIVESISGYHLYLENSLSEMKGPK